MTLGSPLLSLVLLPNAGLHNDASIDEGIKLVVQHVGFCRPAIYAALELGTESFWAVIETLLTSTVLDFEVYLRRVAPAASDQELHQCGRAIRRSIYAALLDKDVSPNEIY